MLTRIYTKTDLQQEESKTNKRYTYTYTNIYARISDPQSRIPVCLQVARLMSAPAVVDECGQRVPGELVFEAQRRNLVVSWGPKTLQVSGRVKRSMKNREHAY